MTDFTQNFGIVIGVWLPGFLFLWGLSFSLNGAAALLKTPAGGALTVGSFLYAALASLSLGMLISALRWLIVDNLLDWMGVVRPSLDFSKVKEPNTKAAFDYINENHYRYYQNYSNTIIALVAAFGAYLLYGPSYPPLSLWMVVAGTLLALFLAARDSLTKFYERAGQILAETKTEGSS